MVRSLNAKAHPHRAGPIGCSGQKRLFQSLCWHGFGATPIMQQGSLPLEQRTAETGSTTHRKRRPTPHKGALGKSPGPNQNGPFLECKPKSMSQWRQRMPQSLGNRRTKGQECASFPKRNWESPLLDHLTGRHVLLMPRHTPTELDPLGALVNNASSRPPLAWFWCHSHHAARILALGSLAFFIYVT